MKAFLRGLGTALLCVAPALLTLTACSSGGASTATQVASSPTGLSSPIAGSASAAPDPLQGTWHTAKLTESDVVDAFVAAGGSKGTGAAFFAHLGGGTKHTAVISIEFQDGDFTEFEAADGGAPHEAYLATYAKTAPSTLVLTSANPDENVPCVGTYSFDISGHVLRLRLLHQCKGHDGPYDTTLFASFPYTK